ncbi:MAG: hypothetical protein FWE34_00690 [Defluviitaleaceae bacterium]|nr:hypothetical protein [Defluviitaleaceae bacterium]
MTNFITILALDGSFAENLMHNVLRGIIPIVVLIVVIGLAIRVTNRKRKDAARQNTQDMMEANEAANQTRNKEIGEELFFTPDMARLPIVQYSQEDMQKPVPPYMWQTKVLDAAQKKMLRFDRQYTNVELKQMFGAANLDNVANYEENFTNFIHAVRFWAEALIATENTDDAQKVLEESVNVGSELSQSYTLLADIYKNSRNLVALQGLLDKVQASNMPGKNIAIKHINALFEEAK